MFKQKQRITQLEKKNWKKKKKKKKEKQRKRSCQKKRWKKKGIKNKANEKKTKGKKTKNKKMKTKQNKNNKKWMPIWRPVCSLTSFALVIVAELSRPLSMDGTQSRRLTEQYIWSWII